MEKVIRQDFIGVPVEVNDICGTIIDETKNMFTIKKKDGKTIRLQKQNQIFIIEVNNKKYSINGNDISFRPEERIKLR